MPLRSFIVFCCFSISVFGQFGRGTISAGAGGGFTAGGENVYQTSYLPDSAAFSAGYEFRVLKYFAPEVSVVNLIPLVPQFGKFPMPPIRERVTLVSIGARGILPLHQGRVELFGGGGAVNVSTSEAYLELGSWLWQVNGGGRIAIGKRRRFWVGPTLRWSRNGGRPTEEWVSLTGDFGFRF
ncbi:MAG TPA: hypothetical protein VK752_29765 [Bryobacteraceae bacterium]|jgi:hypothetical protein|nr:hypothetical protein [Bryobacteraceae bacterium]